MMASSAGVAWPRDEERITYRIDRTEDGGVVVTETVVVEASVGEVWKAYTTADGYTEWAAPSASIDLRAGGEIRTSYDTENGLDGAHVNVLRIINFVPERLLTLQADVSPNWPDVLKKDADNLYNVVLFESLDDGRTKITSYGLGYTDSPELRELMAFFERANHGLYAKLIASLEG